MVTLWVQITATIVDKTLKKITLPSAFRCTCKQTITPLPVSMLFSGGHEQFPGNQHFPSQHWVGGGEVSAVEFIRQK